MNTFIQLFYRKLIIKINQYYSTNLSYHTAELPDYNVLKEQYKKQKANHELQLNEIKSDIVASQLKQHRQIRKLIMSGNIMLQMFLILGHQF